MEVPILRGIRDEVFVYNDSVYSYLPSIRVTFNRSNLSGVKLSDSIMKECYSSATIEGAKTSIGEVINAINGVGVTKDTKMVTNGLEVVKYIKSKKLTMGVMLNCWNTLVNGVCENESVRGERFRSGMVYVGNHIPEHPKRIEPAMQNMIKFIRLPMPDNYSLIRAFIVHFYFAYIHPFCDGNGRMARILTQKVLYDSGYKDIYKVPFSEVILHHRMQYYTALSESERSNNVRIDITPFIEYMCQVTLGSLQSLRVVDKKELNTTAIRIYNALANSDGAEVTVNSCSQVFKIPEGTARDNLNKLTNLGYLIKVKVGRGYIYRVSKLI